MLKVYILLEKCLNYDIILNVLRHCKKADCDWNSKVIGSQTFFAYFGYNRFWRVYQLALGVINLLLPDVAKLPHSTYLYFFSLKTFFSTKICFH